MNNRNNRDLAGVRPTAGAAKEDDDFDYEDDEFDDQTP